MAASSSRLRRLEYAIYRAPIIAMLSLIVFSFWERSGLWMEPAFTLASYQQLFSTNAGQLVQSFQTGIATGMLALVLAFPVAYLVTFVSSDLQRMVILSIFAVPFFVSPFVRILLLVPILGADGVVNSALLTVGLIKEPLSFLLFTNLSVLIGALVSFMPFVIFTGWLSMEMMDRELKRAAEDLGAKPLTTIRTVVGPLALPGLLVGVLFVIAAAMGESIFPRVLGGTNAVSIGLMTQRSFSQLNVPFAAAVAVVSVSAYVLALAVIMRYVSLDELFTAFREGN
jgi:ABC-type spermidine/putrescine transport system permease subunit I